jgi:GT2 family glycosyltransferase
MDIPARVRALASQREQARAERNFIAADACRDEMESLGWLVKDGPDGSELIPVTKRLRTVSPDQVADNLNAEPEFDASIVVVNQGFTEDLARFASAFRTHLDSQTQLIVVDPATPTADEVSVIVDELAATGVFLDRDPGWAAAMNAGIKTARASTVVIADLSIEPTGDIVSPLLAALDDPDVAVVGPIGVVTSDLMNWHEAATSDCDAIEGYLLATRRDLLRDTGLIDERFYWYRNADLALSLQLRAARGGRAVQVSVPFRKHLHRGYLQFADDQTRDRMSRKNYNLLLDRWRQRTDLLTGAPSRS